VWHDPNPWPKKPSDTTPGNPGHINRDPAEVADTYFPLTDHLGTDGLLTAVSRAGTR
jgi:hypothetical protein